jgi:hypothetical protein
VAADEAEDEVDSGRAESTEALWADLRIDPIEIALPGGVGYTLRAYRVPDASVATAERPADEDEEEDESAVDDYDAAAAAVLRRRRAESPEVEAEDDESDDEDLEDTYDEDEDEDDKEDLDESDDEDEDEDDEEDIDDEDLEDDEEDDEDEEDEDEAAAAEEVPIFLGRRGKVYLFHSPDKLVEFVQSGVETDLSQVDTWSDLVDRITADDVVALADDTYELDLVVENLRGGADAWDAPLILRAGELARDLGYALRMPTVIAAMGTGSPLDDLDEALRSAESGGISGFMARRRLRRIPAQQSALAWRTVIGKISAAADWRD